jgi:alginate O-acetyltransferase complex protein AlgI
MAFDEPVFLVFAVLFFALYHFLPFGRRARLRLIAAGGLLFCASWDRRSAVVLVFLGLANYLAAPRIARERGTRLGRAWLALIVGIDVAAMGRAWLAPGGGIPVGFSFLSLQCIGYAVDVDRGLAPCARLDEFMAALTFFPRLAAGPLVRWRLWLPQFRELKPPRWDEVRRAYLLIAAGLVKKTVAGLLAPAVSALFRSGAPLSGLQAWTGALAIAGQIYGSFAGYSDVAVGLGLLMGFSIPPNFELPYAALSPMEFWRRWHISFYDWLNEYIYLPLALTFRSHLFLCLAATVVLAGLWHGARWTFLLYGLYHGAILIAAYRLSRLAGLPHPPRIVATAATFYLVVMGLVLFRSGTVAQASGIWRAMHWPAAPSAFDRGSILELFLVAAALIFCHLLDRAVRAVESSERPAWIWPAAAAGFAFSFILGRGAAAFAYFQF